MSTETAERKNAMAFAAIICGIISVLPVCFSMLSFICGSLGIIFALLSRKDEPLGNHAKLGLILSAAGLLICIVMTAVLIYSLYTSGMFDKTQEIYNSIDWTSENAMADFYSQLQSAFYSYYGSALPLQ